MIAVVRFRTDRRVVRLARAALFRDYRWMRLTPPLLALLLAACQDERPLAPTAEENMQLDEASNMLDNLAAPPAKS